VEVAVKPISKEGFKKKWVSVIDVLYTLDGVKRHAYFHPKSERLKKFKEDRSIGRKIISVTDTKIEKGKHWIN
jgi:hypothetical protein